MQSHPASHVNPSALNANTWFALLSALIIRAGIDKFDIAPLQLLAMSEAASCCHCTGPCILGGIA